MLWPQHLHQRRVLRRLRRHFWCCWSGGSRVLRRLSCAAGAAAHGRLERRRLQRPTTEMPVSTMHRVHRLEWPLHCVAPGMQVPTAAPCAAVVPWRRARVVVRTNAETGARISVSRRNAVAACAAVKRWGGRVAWWVVERWWCGVSEVVIPSNIASSLVLHTSNHRKACTNLCTGACTNVYRCVCPPAPTTLYTQQGS